MGKIIAMAIGVYAGWQLCANRDQIAKRLEEYQGVADSEEPVLETDTVRLTHTKEEVEGAYQSGYAEGVATVADLKHTEDDLALAKQQAFEEGKAIGLKDGRLQGHAAAIQDVKEKPEWIDQEWRRQFPEKAALLPI